MILRINTSNKKSAEQIHLLSFVHTLFVLRFPATQHPLPAKSKRKKKEMKTKNEILLLSSQKYNERANKTF